MQVLSILMRNIPTFCRSLYRFSNDTRATKLVNNRFLQVYTGSVLMIFKQYTLNGKRRVSNGKCPVIKRKQTREKVCGLCLNANSCILLLYYSFISGFFFAVCLSTAVASRPYRCSIYSFYLISAYFTVV